jgi:hypothetical protein
VSLGLGTEQKPGLAQLQALARDVITLLIVTLDAYSERDTAED